MSATDVPGSSMVCNGCGRLLTQLVRARGLGVCPHCGYHAQITAHERLTQLADCGRWTELFPGSTYADPLGFVDTKPYTVRLAETRTRTGLDEAVVCAGLTISCMPILVAAFDFQFMGGSMGNAVGEKLTLLLDEAARSTTPALVCCSSGGARMHEGGFALMQMARTVVAVERLRLAGVPFFVLLAHPTMGGVLASFASLGDVTLAEPGATVGFAGRRVIYGATFETLPEDFQTAEYVHARGLVDAIVPRAELRSTMGTLLRMTAGRRWQSARPPSGELEEPGRELLGVAGLRGRTPARP